jgi:hypothetical protein
MFIYTATSFVKLWKILKKNIGIFNRENYPTKVTWVNETEEDILIISVILSVKVKLSLCFN